MVNTSKKVNRMMKKTSLFALSAISLALVGCGGSSGKINEPGSLSLSGTAKEGETLTASVTDPDGVDTSSVTYTWFANGTVIAGATDSTLTLSVDQAGLTVSVAVTYVDNRNTREGFRSAETAEIEALPINFPGEITLSGSATVEQTLTATVTDANGIMGNISYSWAADGNVIDGETSDSLLLTEALEGAMITANASYTDDSAFAENLSSTPTEAIAPVPVDNILGSLDAPILGDLALGIELSAPTPIDANGITGPITYQWQSRDIGTELSTAVDIAGATSETYTPVADDLGKLISVTVSYTDDAGFVETLTQTSSSEIFTFYVTGASSLVNAVANAVENDSIGIASASDTADNYENIPEIDISVDNITLSLAGDSDAVFTGTTCFWIRADGVTLDGLVFDDIIIPNGDSGCSEGRGSIDIRGDNNIIVNSKFLGDNYEFRNGLGSSDESHYISIDGANNVVERNLIAGKSVNEGEEGTAISIFTGIGDAPNTPGTNTGNIVQYNLFKDFLPTLIVDGSFDTDSGSHAVQIGRSGSGDGAGVGNNILQYNRFDQVLSDRGLVIVQGGGNTIHANTIVNSWGNIELRNGYGSTVSNNIMIASGSAYVETIGGVEGSNNKDGGIAFTPLGHIIVDNFIANSSTDSSDRAGLHIDSDAIDSGNSSTQTLIDAGLDLTTVIARNTLLNMRKAIQFEHDSNRDGIENCVNLDYTLDLDSNLVANQSADNNIFGTSSGAGATAIIADEYPEHGCALNNASDFDNNRIYAEVISDVSPIFVKRDGSALSNGSDGNILADGTQDGASLSAPTDNNLVEGTGDDAGVGVALSELIFIEEDMVGPNSTWTAPTQ